MKRALGHSLTHCQSLGLFINVNKGLSCFQLHPGKDEGGANIQFYMTGVLDNVYTMKVLI